MVINTLVGTVLGFLSGLGIGGGSLLILWLTLVLGMEQTAARKLNLLFFLPAAIISTLFRWKQRCLPIQKILPAMVAGAISAGCFSVWGKNLDVEMLKKGFGFLLMITGLREILYRPES